MSKVYCNLVAVCDGRELETQMSKDVAIWLQCVRGEEQKPGCERYVAI